MRLITPVVRRRLDEGRRDPEAFWEKAAESVPWVRRWDRVFEWTPPTFRWFVGAQTNLCRNAVDHHVERGWGGHAAVAYLNERGARRVLTYSQLQHEVARVAAALRALGLGKGDRLTLYMPTCPEAVILMLASVRIGAIHSVVFAGFGARALCDRIVASGSRLVVTADFTYRKGQRVPLKPIVEQALAEAETHAVEHVVVLEREQHGRRAGDGGTPGQMLWQEFLDNGSGHPRGWEPMEANEPAFILATSGTTAKPKLAVHTHGGYQVHIASMGRWCFGLRPTDVWWATSDIGWIVGHSYTVYAPLLAGCTTVVYEGALEHPGAEVNWRTVVEELGVTGLLTSPTAVRMLMRYGDETLGGVDHSLLERVFCAGEVLSPHVLDWLQNQALGGTVPVIDHMWQTETGGPVVGNPYGIGMLPIKPGSACVPLPGIDATVLHPDGRTCAPGEKGIMVIRRPFPGLTPALWGEPERYGRDYWQRVSGDPVYYSGDSAYVDEDGYYWFAGRADEIIKIASHRLGSIEVETVLLKHPAVAECGVVGRPDELRGEVISAFVLLKGDQQGSDDLRDELLAILRRELGAVAVVGEINFVSMLPKTRSGKIMRRVLRAVVLNRDPGDVTAIEDEGSVEEARQAWEQMKAETRRSS